MLFICQRSITTEQFVEIITTEPVNFVMFSLDHSRVECFTILRGFYNSKNYIVISCPDIMCTTCTLLPNPSYPQYVSKCSNKEFLRPPPGLATWLLRCCTPCRGNTSAVHLQSMYVHELQFMLVLEHVSKLQAGHVSTLIFCIYIRKVPENKNMHSIWSCMNYTMRNMHFS